jgi:hypothetical protein
MAVAALLALEPEPFPLECTFCHLETVHRQEDGSYVCRVCHGVQEFRDTYHELDAAESQSLAVRSYHIRQESSDDRRLNFVVLAEAVQLILAVQTVAVEDRLGVPISDSVFRFLTQFRRYLKPPFKQETFSLLVLLVLSGVLDWGIPMTHLDLIRWIRDGVIPFTDPLGFLPGSFCERLSKSEQKCLDVANVTNLNQLITAPTGHKLAYRIHPLPNPKLVLWRIASFLNLPERAFVAFALNLASARPFNKIARVSSMANYSKTDELYTIRRLMKIGYAMPIALAIFALTIIYRLDGTDWIHPEFVKLGFPSFRDILREILIKAEIGPVFPLMTGHLPDLHEDIARLLDEHGGPIVQIHAVIADTRDGFGCEAILPYGIESLASLNPDLRAILVGISREFGIRELMVMQQLVLLTEKRLGNEELTRQHWNK